MGATVYWPTHTAGLGLVSGGLIGGGIGVGSGIAIGTAIDHVQKRINE